MYGLALKLNVQDETGIDKSVTTITEQIPKKGISIEKGTTIICEIK